MLGDYFLEDVDKISLMKFTLYDAQFGVTDSCLVANLGNVL